MEQGRDRFPATVQLIFKIMAAIKLKKRLWGIDAEETIEVNERLTEFALRKGYAELVPEKKVEKIERKTKVDPELKGRKKKDAN